MHYKIENMIVKSENSAKPINSPSFEFIAMLQDFIDLSDTVLDFGCGKLRYTVPLSKFSNHVVGVDSKEQLTRIIQLDGKKTTLVEYSAQFANIELYSTSNKSWEKIVYNKIVLAHVLSSIPFDDERVKVIRMLLSVMNEQTKLIACTTHRMSYFKKWEQSERIIHFNNGYLVRTPNPSYFGIINKDKLAEYFESNGYEIIKTFISNDNSYCICKRA